MNYDKERRHERYPTSLAMRLRLNNHTYAGRLVNISASGALVRTHATPLLDATMILHVQVPGCEEPVEMLARVIHVIFPNTPGPVAVGVQLENAPAALGQWEIVVEHARRESAPVRARDAG
jgi:hypothetical protein